MAKRVWKRGPPPHVGWWNASAHQNIHIWRWWDGSRWSLSATRGSLIQSVRNIARTPAWIPQDTILWTDYWPENARVPRIDPRGAQS